MRALLKNEFRRTLLSARMLYALLVGAGICIWYANQYVWGVHVYDQDLSYCPRSMFFAWIGAHGFPVQSFVYFLALPLLAVLPGADTYFEDQKSQYVIQVYTRCARWKYLAAKYLSVFVSGGLAFALPQVFSVLISAAHFPALAPEPIDGIGPAQTGFLCELYYTHPWRYLLIFLCLNFCFAGGMATISLVVSHYAEHRLSVVLIPFIIYFSIYCVDNLLNRMNFAPNYFLIAGMDNNMMAEYAISGIAMVGVAVFYFVKGLRYGK